LTARRRRLTASLRQAGQRNGPLGDRASFTRPWVGQTPSTELEPVRRAAFVCASRAVRTVARPYSFSRRRTVLGDHPTAAAIRRIDHPRSTNSASVSASDIYEH
jgi:hypothetical protein